MCKQNINFEITVILSTAKQKISHCIWAQNLPWRSPLVYSPALKLQSPTRSFKPSDTVLGRGVIYHYCLKNQHVFSTVLLKSHTGNSCRNSELQLTEDLKECYKVVLHKKPWQVAEAKKHHSIVRKCTVVKSRTVWTVNSGGAKALWLHTDKILCTKVLLLTPNSHIFRS